MSFIFLWNMMFPQIIAHAKNGGATTETFKIRSYSSVTEALAGKEGLNTYLLKGLQYAGFVLVALGILVLIMSFQEQNFQNKSRASLMIAGGALMASVDAIITILMPKNEIKSGKAVTTKVLDILGVGMQWVGVILIAVGLIQGILAFQNLNQEEKANASKGLGVGIFLMFGSSITKKIGSLIGLSASALPKKMSKMIITDFIGIASTYIGLFLIAYGLIQFFISFKDEDSMSKTQAGMVISTGVGLAAAPAILTQILFK